MSTENKEQAIRETYELLNNEAKIQALVRIAQHIDYTSEDAENPTKEEIMDAIQKVYSEDTPEENKQWVKAMLVNKDIYSLTRGLHQSYSAHIGLTIAHALEGFSQEYSRHIEARRRERDAS